MHQSAGILPRTKRGTIDVEASLRMWGITDLQMLWQKKFKRGTAGTALKCVLGSKGRKPARPAMKRMPLIPQNRRPEKLLKTPSLACT